MNLTICYLTARTNCRWRWFVDSLCRQVSAEDFKGVQVVFVDAKLHALTPEAANLYFRRDGRFPLADEANHNWARRRELEDVVDGRFTYLHIPPLRPSAWQGPFRLTSKDWFCASNARNTAFIVAEHDYIVCVDDLSVLGPIWFAQVRHAAESGYVVCGAYKKLLEMRVENGQLAGFVENPKGVDSRWGHGSDDGIVPWNGRGMFGCSFGVPTSLVETVDGNDTSADGAGAEDYDFGIRLERAGGKFFYNRNMVTYESEEGHTEEPSLPREAKLVPFDRIPAGIRKYYPDGLMSDHVMLQSVLRDERVTPLIPNHLAQMRDQWKRERVVQIPPLGLVDWRTGQPLSEL